MSTTELLPPDIEAMIEAAETLPQRRSQAIAAASSGIDAIGELVRFHREGPSSADAPAGCFAISVVEHLADAAQLAIHAQGGPEDGEEGRFLAACLRYLDRPTIIGEAE